MELGPSLTLYYYLTCRHTKESVRNIQYPSIFNFIRLTCCYLLFSLWLIYLRTWLHLSLWLQQKTTTMNFYYMHRPHGLSRSMQRQPKTRNCSLNLVKYVLHNLHKEYTSLLMIHNNNLKNCCQAPVLITQSPDLLICVQTGPHSMYLDCQEVRFGVYLVHIRMFHRLYIYHDILL